MLELMDNKKVDFLSTSFNNYSMEESVNKIKQRLLANEFVQHCVVNVAKLVHMQKDAELKRSVESCDIINIDGMGVVWGARFCGHYIPERVAGVDLFNNLLVMSRAEGFPVFLLGATEEVVVKTAQNVQRQHEGLKIAGYHHGYFWDDEKAVVRKIRESGAKLLFVAITSPRKENFISKWKDELGVNFVMGVGGTFDVVAGKVNRAPVWMQKTGMEWLYRVIQEPGRMWKRYLYTNTKFLTLLFKERLKQKT